MSDLFIASREAIPPDDSRRAVIKGASRGAWMGVKGRLADTDATIDALREARRQPQGHFLRLYRAGTWPKRPAREKAS